jgi:pilus assembly protein CpaB
MEDKEIGKAKFGALGFGLIAAACAVFAGFIVYSFITSSSLKEEKSLKVLVITTDLNAGDELKKDMVKTVERPESQVPEKAARSLDQVFKDGKKRVAATGILAGEYLFEARLADPDRGTAMAALVQHGYRAVPVKVDGAVARSGLVHPGAFVDIVGTIRDPKTFVSVTRLAVENVRVLSVEAATDVETYKSAEKKKDGDGVGGAPSNTNNAPQDAVMTIEVTPEQMEVVLLAQREGKVDVALRNAADKESVPTKGATPQRLIGVSAQARSADSDEREAAARDAAETRAGQRHRRERPSVSSKLSDDKNSVPVVMAPGGR